MKNKVNLFEALVKVLLFTFVFVLSVVFLNLATKGDQLIYNKVYEYMGGKSLFDSYLYYSANLSKFEFVHFLLSYLGSNLGLDKAVYMSLFNVCLFASGLSFLRSYSFPLILSIAILLSNYYLFALMFSAERLKFAFIFLFVFLSIKGINRSKKIVPIVLSIFAHVQVIVFYSVIFFEGFISEIAKALKTLKIKKSSFVFSVFFLVACIYLANPIGQKILFYIGYYADTIWLGVVKWIVFYMVVFISTKNKKVVSVRFFILLIPILIVGAERLLLFCLFLYFMEYPYRTKYYKLFLYPIILYLMVKSIYFLNNIYLYGTGYA